MGPLSFQTKRQTKPALTDAIAIGQNDLDPQHPADQRFEGQSDGVKLCAMKLSKSPAVFLKRPQCQDRSTKSYKFGKT